ncbi:MAG TPA: sugar phosphate isomerase/epimerase family protein [Planctomycetota bacterium]|nr:sugar phosphate isomerase/epimerase family protein [Planctomycetota bacterium]
MKYAVFTVCMPEFTVEEGIAKLVEWGYDGVEWRVVNQRPSADGRPGFWSGNRCTLSEDELLDVAEAVGRRCRDAGLEVCALASYLKCDQTAGVERLFEACNRMGTGCARVGLPPVGEGENFRDYFDRVVEQYAAVETLAKKHGVKALLETHHGTAIASASSVYRFVSHFDAKHVGVIHDAGNMVHEGFENYRFALELLGDHLVEVHVKNAKWEKTGETGPEGQAIWKASWCELKTGVVNWADVYAALRSVGYDGWLSLEDFSTERPTEEKLPDDLAYLKALEASV